MIDSSGEMNKFIQRKEFKNYFAAPVESGASLRKYYRLTSNTDSFILAYYPQKIVKAMDRFQFWSKELSRLGFNVPTVLRVYRNHLCVEDLGDSTLEKLYHAQIVGYDNKIESAIHIISQIQNIDYDKYVNVCQGYEATQKAYLKRMNEVAQAIKGNREKEFLGNKTNMINQFIEYYRNNYTKLFEGQPKLCFSDFQSRNLIEFCKKIYIIDYQDIIIGPDVLDISALLFDPYVSYSDEDMERYLNNYRKSFQTTFSYERFYIQTVYKLLHAIGVYLNMIINRHQENYIIFLNSAFQLLQRLDFLINSK